MRAWLLITLTSASGYVGREDDECTHMFCKRAPVMLDGRPLPISAFLTNVNVVTLSSEEKKLSGRLESEVDSR